MTKKEKKKKKRRRGRAFDGRFTSAQKANQTQKQAKTKGGLGEVIHEGQWWQGNEGNGGQGNV